MAISSYRRYCFLREKDTCINSVAISSTWRGKRLSESGTAFVAAFPHQAKLIAADYLVLEDVEDASESELLAAGLSQDHTDDILEYLNP